MGKIRIQIGAVAVVAVTMLALAPVSYGLSSSVETYGGQGGNVAGSVASGTTGGPGATVSPTSTSASSSSSLPFTGLDVVLLGGGGLLLLLAGVAMARMAGRTSPDGGS
jgi:hypothetical protein